VVARVKPFSGCYGAGVETKDYLTPKDDEDQAHFSAPDRRCLPPADATLFFPYSKGNV
jgi:hypothetical protein